MIYVGEGRAWKFRSLRTPEDPARYYSQKGTFFLFQSWRPLYTSVCTRYEFRCHLTLAVDFVHAYVPNPRNSGENVSQILLREATVSNRACFFSFLITIVPRVDFRKSITMALVGDDKLRDSSRLFSCSDFLRGANRYKLADV